MKKFCKLLDAIYTICLAVFVLACIAMLLVQVGCLITMNGVASAWLYYSKSRCRSVDHGRRGGYSQLSAPHNAEG